MLSINPATGAPLATYTLTSASDAEQAAARAAIEARAWQALGFSRRAEAMQEVAQLLRQRAPGHAELMAREMGKPISEGLAEIEKCAWVCEYFAENAKGFLETQLIESDASSSYVVFEPLGVVFAIMPWNFPFWQFFRFAAPALMAGNAVLLKHSSLVPGCAEALASVLRDAGIPEGVFAQLCLSREQAESLIEHDAIAAVTFTGSTSGGRAVAARAGGALKKMVLELGGSDPYLILGDADLAAAADVCVQSRMGNAGQSCIAAKRCIAVREVREAFEQLLIERMAALQPGDPLDPNTRLGPLASERLRDALHRQVQVSLAAGATLMLGGSVPQRPGAWYPPTVLSSVAPGMPAYDEELFGPVACVLEARDEEDAIRIANDTRYGLGAAVFSRDRARAERIAKHRLSAGSCFVNTLVHSDPRLPFGGTKQSGYGRELSLFGIQEFVNIKTVYV
ncbi:MAG TPA: NAD-dependent succinate-semialdehyde dehydrogenase, partial [Polyangiaceae bacterium]|nr:NAD-dependent succinate-semialdehyde dehydrogenase [Polyangiaceae bacterium]